MRIRELREVFDDCYFVVYENEEEVFNELEENRTVLHTDWENKEIDFAYPDYDEKNECGCVWVSVL